ncbi:MAG: TSUP family transporter [Chitinivorax sp.]
MNALKTALTTLINGTAVLAFVLSGQIALQQGLLVGVGGLLGGYGGARLARRVSAARLKQVVVIFGLLLTVHFFSKTYL